MPLFLSESDVEALLTPAEAVPLLEESFRRLAGGGVENVPRRRLALDDGYFAIMAATDRELGYAGLKSYTVVGGTIGLLTVAVSYTSFRFPRLRPTLDGEPVIVLEDGKPIDRNLRRNRITIEELAAEARLQQFDSLGDLRWAVLETNGRISFIPKRAS